QLVGMLIVVLVKKSAASSFSNVQTCTAAAGILGVMGNKGAVATRLTFTPPLSDSSDTTTTSTPGPTVLTFVSSHLAAFDEMVDKRNSDFHDVSKKMKFTSGFMDAAGTSPVHVSVYDSDVLFWMASELRLFDYAANLDLT
ncbi:hypothetical protein H0H93_003927, partial [Arthromyces matolae]